MRAAPELRLHDLQYLPKGADDASTRHGAASYPTRKSSDTEREADAQGLDLTPLPIVVL